MITNEELQKIMPEQYCSKIKKSSVYNGYDVIIKTDNTYLSLPINLIKSIDVTDQVIKLNIQEGRLFYIITIWRNITSVHTNIFYFDIKK